MPTALIKQITNLDLKSICELRSMYKKLYCEAATVKNKSQLIRKIAYRLQELEYGFLPDKYVKKLNSLADDMMKGKKFGNKNYVKPCAGTKLKREYCGVIYEVESVENGFLFEGQQYKSLSSVARKITGTRWNGLRFFGVCK